MPSVTARPGERSAERGACDGGASGAEQGSYGGFIAVDVDEPMDVVEGERTRCQPENDRGVSAHDDIEIAPIMQGHLHTRARRPHLEQPAVDRDPHRRRLECGPAA